MVRKQYLINLNIMEKLNLKKSIQKLLAALKDKEREVLKHRFGLFDKEAKTLAAIGKNLNLTRERIRQIQNSGIKRIKKSALQEDVEIFSHIKSLTKDRGGVIHVNDIVKSISGRLNDVIFILESSQHHKKLKGQKSLASVYIDKDLDEKKILETEIEIIKVLKKIEKALHFDKIYEKYQETKEEDSLSKETINSLVESSQSFARDWDEKFGLSIWREVNPKSARDKAHFVVKKIDRPIHFTHIAKLIEEEDFRGKDPTAATVHNELILDDRFVLVGRGMYALSEWGFRGGTVEDVIEEILRENPEGMLREKVIAEVLKKKMVAKNTVVMNLLVKDKFKKDQKGVYRLASR